MLEINNLTKTYYQGKIPVHAAQGISFRVDDGEFVAVTGPSGSGKSTVLNLIGGLDVPTSGDILLNGRSIPNRSDRERTTMRRREMGFIFQFFNLLPTLTALENVAMPLLLDGRRRKEAFHLADRMLARVGLEKRVAHKPTELSGGEQQRVAIARALVFDPALLLADEPTGNLDSKAGGQIMEMMRSLSKDLNKIVLLVTHDPGSLKFADRVVRLVDGQVASIEPGDRS